LLVSGFIFEFSEITVHLKKLTRVQFTKNGPLFCESPRIIIMSTRAGGEKRNSSQQRPDVITS
jgi:hypothetical protein